MKGYHMPRVCKAASLGLLVSAVGTPSAQMDFLYVENAVAAHLAAAERLLDTPEAAGSVLVFSFCFVLFLRSIPRYYGQGHWVFTVVQASRSLSPMITRLTTGSSGARSFAAWASGAACHFQTVTLSVFVWCLLHFALLSMFRLSVGSRLKSVCATGIRFCSRRV
jgi:hypothetical protein